MPRLPWCHYDNRNPIAKSDRDGVAFEDELVAVENGYLCFSISKNPVTIGR